jgi:murein DD-endopeptidase MepM/ murein hydrolase activator NlpD
MLIAEDDVGNKSEVKSFFHKFSPRPIGTDKIMLQDKFLEKVTTEILGQTSVTEIPAGASLLDKYLFINRELRKRNNGYLRELAKKTRPAFLWNDTFIQMPDTAVKGSFADRRTYMYQGAPVDTQDHLGFDLASVERAPVPAANAGVIVHAGYLGIFGNTVVVDHGFGLMSLYAHLSTIDVKEGAEIARAAPVGRTGSTGLAGGDHLHFTMLLHGLPVTPVEWWDGHWIQDRVKLKLGAILPWGTPAAN